MKKQEILVILGLATLIAIPVLLSIFVFDKPTDTVDQPPVQEEQDNDKDNKQPDKNKDNQSGEDAQKESDQKDKDKEQDKDKEKDKEGGSDSGNKDGNNEGDSNKDKEDGKEVYWGVDSASYTDEELYSCVVDNFGEPKVWGRYLGDIEGVAQGIDKDEANFLHDNDIKILVVYNLIEDATGYDHGAEHANEAISMAEDLEIPEGVAIFGDIEPSFPVDSAFIEGWYDTLAESAYEPAIYGVFDKESAILEAYNATKKDTQENTVVWTAYPQEEITTKDNAPEYNPQGPESSMLYGWQYAIEAEECTIDTNLFKDEMLDYLW